MMIWSAGERKSIVRGGYELAGEKSVLEQSYNLLEYLSAVAREIGPKPVRDVRNHPMLILPSAVPEHRAVKIGPDADRSQWLSVERVTLPAAAHLPDVLFGIITPEESLSSTAKTPRLADELVSARVEAAVAAEFGPPQAEDDEDVVLARAELRETLSGEIQSAFAEWMTTTWSPWAERNRPAFAARDLYSALYDLHLQAEAASATHEVVWGHLILSVHNGDEVVVAPMFTTRVDIQVDPLDATVRVAPEQPLSLELDSIEGTGLRGLDGLVALQESLRQVPPDLWSADERLIARQQVTAPLGVDAVLVDSMDPAMPTAAPQVNDGWVLFMRKRPLRQERFYDELAHKIRDENFLPEGLASVVADSDRVDNALRQMAQTVAENDGTANRLLMPLPANDEQIRIAGQLARSRGVTVQGPPGTGKSHTIVNLVSHLVAQGKRVLVTAEKEQALAVLRDKIPEELRDLSLAVLGSTPTAMEDLRGAAQSMQDSLSAIDVPREERRVSELGVKVDELRDSILRTDHALVTALQSEQREYDLPSGPTRAPDVAKWLAEDREVDVIEDRVPDDADLPVTPDELRELAHILATVDAEDSSAAVLELPDASWLPTAAELRAHLLKLDSLRSKVTDLEDRGLRVEALDALDLGVLREHAAWFRESAAILRGLMGEWEDRYAAAIRRADPAVSWVMQHNPGVRQKLAESRELASRLAGHVIEVPEGNPATQIPMLLTWGERISAGKKLSMFTAKELRDFSEKVTVEGYPITTQAQLDLALAQVKLRVSMREAHVLMTQAYAPCQILVPPLEESFVFVAEQVAARVDAASQFWSVTHPLLVTRVRSFVNTHDAMTRPESLEGAADLLDGAASRAEERELQASLNVMKNRINEKRVATDASLLWSSLSSALELANPDRWAETMGEVQRLAEVRSRVIRAEELREKLSHGGAPIWARSILNARGADQVVGDVANFSLAWERAKARTWLLSLHAESHIERLMTRSHSDAEELRRAIVELASRSARVELKKNFKDRQRRALETWLTAVKRVGKGTGKNAPRFQAAAREALPGAMGAVPIWIMPIYRVMENFDPRVSELFDVVVVDESSQCDLLSLGVLALGKKTVVVGDDKQTTPEFVGVQTDRIAALQDQHLRGMPEAKLLTLDDSLYSISSRAFPSTIALKEHFRCVSEIIGFSNRYYGGGILPLREVGVPEIGEPIRVVCVENAVSTLGSSGRVNMDEAQAIATQVAECVDDSAYDGLTFGVVTMMSGPQAQIIQDLIREKIGDAEFEQRRLRVGNPPLFQGDERNIVFVSMVAHDSSFAATSNRYAQWANVAASRAQDQLWIFHSMDPATLNHQDHRRAMIEYANGVAQRGETESLYDLTESLFERHVLKQLLDRGYDVTPQYRVGSYRIDFVVRVAAGERLAVECDGDSFHGPEKWDDDVRRQRVLERLGWSFWRIRASRYYLDPEEAMAPLWSRLEQLRERAAEAAEMNRARQERETQRRLKALREQVVESASALTSGQVASEAGVDSAIANTVPSSADLTRNAALPDMQMHSSSLVTPSSPKQTGLSISTALPADASILRGWARANGHSIGDRGRISSEVVAAYLEANIVTQRGDVAETSSVEVSIQEPVGVTDAAAASTRSVGTASPRPELDQAKSEQTADAAAVWQIGASYQLDTQGNIVPLHGGSALAAVVGHQAAGDVRDLLRRVRPSGGRFKVDHLGNVATLLDGEPVYVCAVSRDNWFPAHWGRS